MSDYDEFNKAIKLAKEKNVANTIAFLKNNGIVYFYSGISNVVKINVMGTFIFLSLKKEYGSLKYRFAGNDKWQLISKKDFIKMITKN